MKKKENTNDKKIPISKRFLLKRVNIVVASFVIGIGCISYYFYKTRLQSNPCHIIQNDERYSQMQKFNDEDLSVFDGVKNEKTYIGYHCLVYDVTAGKDEYYATGRGYHYLVGRDATKQLEVFGGDIIQEKYPVVGVLKKR